MALTSPGVQVTVIDESFYTPAEPGTTPLIVIATAQDKLNAAGTGTAIGTTAANALKAFKITSQRELVDTFGVPFFEQTASASPVHGGERNEYGLLAAYSYLGVSNAAFIVRADVNLAELEGQTSAPGANPDDGDWWIDTQATAWGIQQWNGAGKDTVGGQKFATKTPIVLTDDEKDQIVDGNSTSGAPKESVGQLGDYAVVLQDSTTDKTIRYYYKSPGNSAAGVPAGTWVLVGSNDWAASIPTVMGTSVPTITSALSGDFKINNTVVSVQTGDDADDIVGEINGKSITGVTAVNQNNKVYLYADQTAQSNGVTADGAIKIESIAAGAPVTQGGFVIGYSYKITSLGTTTQSEWNNIAGTTGVVYAVNDEFVADMTGDGSGNGTATRDTADVSLPTTIGLSTGTYYGPALQQTPHTQVPEWKLTDASPRPTGSVWVKTTESGGGARIRVKRWSDATESWIPNEAPIYASGHAALYYLDRSGGGINLPKDVLYTQSNSTEDSGSDSTPSLAVFSMWKRTTAGSTVIKSTVIGQNTFNDGATITFNMAESLTGQLNLSAKTVTFTIGPSSLTTDSELMAAGINAAGFTNIVASVTSDNRVQIAHKTGGEIRFTSGSGGIIGTILGSSANVYAAPAGESTYDYIGSNWGELIDANANATGDAPLNEPMDGQLWYNPNFGEVDIMIHDGSTWVGYGNGVSGSDAEGPQITATAPTTQSGGGTLVEGDLWISTADLENFPTIYRWDAINLEWMLIDKTDQTTEEGILFADARYGTSGATGNTAATIKALLTSDYLDPDAPDPDLYPKGMLLWNLRRSGGNVKRYNNNYINTAGDNPRFNNNESMSGYATDRWTTASPNNEDGSGSFGRKAQRALVVQKIKSCIDTSSEIRDEERRNFNLISAPGYPEALSNLINLNLDRGLTAFVLGDTPLRLPADATSLTAWGTNANGALDNGDAGIVSYDEYCAVYYPNGFTTDLSGANAVVPATHMMLRTIALSDQVSYPWFAPAGTRRGGITNATAVGYIDSLTGEFQGVALNEGQRDTLYDLKVNPIPFFVGVGHVAYGQKTRARNASALDRINVARLVVYLRSQLQKLARPYIFEPNDKITRDEIKGAVESLLLELVGLRALYDFAVVCDESNNTPSRIDRNELYVDIAIEPIKAVEFIYIPLRIKNTGEI